MTAGLETFAKVRALHDRTTSPGEKAAAAGRMKALASAAGMTVAEAVSKLDAADPKPSSFFHDLFNTPEFRARRAEQEREDAARRAAVLAEHGSEEAVWEPCAWERALEEACRPVVTRKPITGGEMDTLMGWNGGRLERMPPEVLAAVSRAYPLPATVREAWAEFTAWEKLADDRCAFWSDHSPDVRVNARTVILEHLLDTLPARDMRDLRARLDWMQHGLDLDFSRDVLDDQACLTALRADIERMAVQSGQPVTTGTQAPDCPPAPVETGHAEGGSRAAYPSRRTTADKRRDVLALLKPGISGFGPLTDREIARRVGVSPTTVGSIRRAAQGAGR